MRFKINRAYANSYQLKGKLYHQYRSIFFELLKEDDYGLPGIAPRDLFIEMPESQIGQELKSLFGDGDQKSVLIGYTGMGKTVNIKHYVCESRKPILQNDYLVVPFCYNKDIYAKEETIKLFIAQTLMSAARCLANEFKFDLSEETKRFHSYVHQNGGNIFLDPEKPLKQPSFDEDFEYANKTNPVNLHIHLLEYLLGITAKNKRISGVFFIVDDIELLENHLEMFALKIHMKLHQAFSITEYTQKRDYSVKTLISARPHIYRHALHDSRVLKGLNWDSMNQVRLTVTPPIKEIVEKRISLMLKHYNTNDYEEANDIIHDLLETIEREFSRIEGWPPLDDFMLGINHYNIRKSLKTFYRVLTSSKLQSNDAEHGAFGRVRKEDFYITPATIIRALAYGDSDVYKYDSLPDLAGEKSHIPNILYNQQDDGRDLLTLLVIAYVYQKQDKTNDSAFHFYATTATRSEILDKLQEINEPYFVRESIESRIEYLLSGRVLMKSISEPEDPNDDMHPSGATELYLSTRGVCLYKLLCEYSLLLEIYRDDLWLEKGVFSEDPTWKLNQRELFKESIALVNRLFIEESRLLHKLNNESNEKVRLYIKYFGPELQTLRLVRGIRRSLTKLSDYSVYRDIGRLVNDLYEKIELAQRRLEEIANAVS